MVHIFYILLISLMVAFLPKSSVKTETLKQPVKVACPKPPLKNAILKSVPSVLPPATSRPLVEDPIDLAGIFNQLPKQYLFDPQVVTERTHLNLTDYTQKEILNENDYTITYRLTAPSGHSIEQTIEKADGKVSFERWKDERGGEVRRGYYQFGVEDKYIDREGNGFEVSRHLDGSYTIARHSNKGVSESYGYDKDGNVTGVFVYRRESEE